MNAWAQLLAAAASPTASLRAAIQKPRETQERLLAAILRANNESAFGRRHDFARLRDFADYQAAVPIRSYEDFAPLIEPSAAGEHGVLTTAPIVAFEETGGSSRGGKLIPYTQASLDSFRIAVLSWLGELLSRRPNIATGRAYVSISPAARATRQTAGGAPIGLADDTYLGADLAPAFGALLAVPADVGSLASLDFWRDATLRHLIDCEDLSFVSVWSPTFFLDLIRSIPAHADRITPQLGAAARARLAAAIRGDAIDAAILWPGLDTISCWTDGASTPFAQQLASIAPSAHIDAKGLLATEAPVTIGWDGAGVPALNSVFLEFFGTDGDARLVDELIEGERYTVVVTTWGGLYRYDLGDEVCCIGHCGATPRLRFAGRGASCSDLVGEKLTESFVTHILGCLAKPAALTAVPEDKPHYELWLDAATPLADAALAQVEHGLRANPQYAYARELGQLGPLTQVARPDFPADIVEAGLRAGRRLGDIKPTALLSAAQRAVLNARPPKLKSS